MVDSFKALVHRLNSGRRNQVATLPEGYVDVLTLSENRLIKVLTTGESIAGVQASVSNRSTRPLKVRILRGTYFVSTGGFQNMVARKEYEFELSRRATQHISVEASCMNAHLRVPNSGDKFAGVARASEELNRFLNAAVREDALTIQAGVWAVTDGYDREMLLHRLRSRTVRQEIDRGPWQPPPSGAPAHGLPPITDEQIDRAAVLLSRLGIRHALMSRELTRELAVA